MASNGSSGIRDSPLEPGIFLDEDLGSDWYLYESTESALGDDLLPDAIPECHPTISPRLYHTIMAPISLAVILALSFPAKRRRLHRSCWSGVPGLLSSGNLEEDGSRAPAAAAFALQLSALFQLLLDREPLPLAAPAGHGAREFWKLLALLYYPALYWPLLACAAARRRRGYVHGLYSALCHIPALLALALLSLWYPALLIRSLRQRPEPQIPGKGYYRKYLKAVLSKRGRKGSSVGIEESRWSRIRSYLRSYFYIPEEGFRIPLKLLVSVTTAVIAVYQVALLLLLAVVPTIRIVRAGMTKDVVVLLVQLGLVPSENPAVPGDMEKELGTVRHYLWALEVCYISSLVFCCLLTCAMLLRTLAMHRSNLRALYQGAVLDVFSKAQILRPSRESVVSWIGFSAFQAAFACLGLLIQQVIFFLCSVAFAFLVVIPLQAGRGSPLLGIVRNVWPLWLFLFLAVLLQHLLAHFHFLQRNSLSAELAHRCALSVTSFLLFPTNVLVGLVAGVWRVVISGLYNSVHFCRLDISLLHRRADTFDPGYHSYCHYLRVEVSQCHPLLKAFCFLLLQPHRPEPPRDTQLEEGLQLMHPKHPAPGKARIRQIRARWCLAYTLLHNPSLSASRKTALANPAANGAQLGVPRP
ncbi:PREDICTED: stimulated by retinoic acid gene 6 protein homolog [Pseudopodoces humilis]|uniref:stimulated by retinoic acid gene 6 protein homolog n=1 Tax=Pseudopodoces humilis TaxID=181119 RepID=UPI0003959767|nr:PREDICTED: stimulated by retinoic acid gene 6 protein homolog [Pseudopodoces humilis]